MSGLAIDIQERIQPVLLEVENARVAALDKKSKAVKTSIIIVLGSLLLGGLLGGLSGHPLFFVIVIALGVVISLVTYHFTVGSSVKDFKYLYKSRIVNAVTKQLQPNINYHPYRGLSKSTFSAVGHYNSSIDRYHSEDLFEGKIGDTFIQFSELHAEDRRTRTDAKGNTETYYVTIFQGILFIADFNKHFNTWVTVNPDNESDGFFGWIGKKVQKLGGNLVRLESPEFEKHFVVRSPDQVEARYILTPAMQERLLELREQMPGKMKISFQRSCVNITVEKSSNWFEPDIKTPVHCVSHINRLAAQMHCYFQIVEILDLNTRIWTKD